MAARDVVNDVYVAPSVKDYVLDLVESTRNHPDVIHGTSPRATLAFLNGAKARAALRGRDYVIPDDVKELADVILIHRLVLSTDADLSNVSPDDVVGEVVDSVEPPGAATAEPPAAGDAQ